MEAKLKAKERMEVIEAAYLAGFEPSKEDLTDSELFEEAVNFLTANV